MVQDTNIWRALDSLISDSSAQTPCYERTGATAPKLLFDPTDLFDNFLLTSFATNVPKNSSSGGTKLQTKILLDPPTFVPHS